MRVFYKEGFWTIFFETTVNQHTYLHMLKTFFWPKLLRDPSFIKYYFQQDGAPAHTSNIVQEWCTSKFGKKFLAKEDWPPRSPDLNPCDFFLWGYLKSKVYNPLPKNLDYLKLNKEREIKNISAETLKSVFSNLTKRCKMLISVNGGHFENK